MASTAACSVEQRSGSMTRPGLSKAKESSACRWPMPTGDGPADDDDEVEKWISFEMERSDTTRGMTSPG
eukprot:scaffold26556_cov46-Attheya_sp.AAC.3